MKIPGRMWRICYFFRTPRQRSSIAGQWNRGINNVTHHHIIASPAVHTIMKAPCLLNPISWTLAQIERSSCRFTEWNELWSNGDRKIIILFRNFVSSKLFWLHMSEKVIGDSKKSHYIAYRQLTYPWNNNNNNNNIHKTYNPSIFLMDKILNLVKQVPWLSCRLKGINS